MGTRVQCHGELRNAHKIVAVNNGQARPLTNQLKDKLKKY